MHGAVRAVPELSGETNRDLEVPQISPKGQTTAGSLHSGAPAGFPAARSFAQGGGQAVCLVPLRLPIPIRSFGWWTERLIKNEEMNY